MSARDEFRAAMAAAGLPPPDDIIADGKIHRFSTSGKRRDDAGVYIFHEDERPAGWFKCHRSGVEATWSVENRREFTAEEKRAWRERMDLVRAERERDDQERRTAAAKQAADIWKSAKPANGHPYLERKGIAGEAAASTARELDTLAIEYKDKT